MVPPGTPGLRIGCIERESQRGSNRCMVGRAGVCRKKRWHGWVGPHRSMLIARQEPPIAQALPDNPARESERASPGICQQRTLAPAPMQCAAVCGTPLVGSAQLCSARTRRPAAAAQSSSRSRRCSVSAAGRLNVVAVSGHGGDIEAFGRRNGRVERAGRRGRPPLTAACRHLPCRR